MGLLAGIGLAALLACLQDPDAGESGRALPLAGARPRLDAVAAISASEGSILSWGQDGDLLLRNPWDALRPERLSSGSPPGLLSVSRDSRRADISGRRGPILVLELPSGRQLRSWPVSSEVRAVALSSDGSRLAAALQDRRILVIDSAADQKPTELQGSTAGTGCIALSEDGRLLAVGGDDGEIGLRDFVTGKTTAAGKKHAAPVAALAFSADGSRIISADVTGLLVSWDATLRVATPIDPGGPVSCIAVDPDGRTLAAGAPDGRLRFWDAETGKLQLTRRLHDSQVMAVAFLEKGTKVLSCGKDGSSEEYDQVTGASASTRPVPRQEPSIAWSPRGDRLALSIAGGGIRLLRPSDGREIGSVPGHGSDLRALAVAPDGGSLASAAADGTVRQFDLPSGRERQTWTDPRGGAEAISFTPDGAAVAVLSRSSAAVSFWNSRTGAPMRVIPESDSSGLSMSFSPDGTRYCALPAGGPLRIRERETGKVVAVLPAWGVDQPGLFAFSPEGDIGLTAGTNQPLRFLDLDSGRTLAAIDTPAWRIRQAAFSPDGRFVATLDEDGVLRIHERATCGLVRTIQRPEGRIAAFAFSPDGASIATASVHGTGDVWDWMPEGNPESLAELWRRLMDPDAAAGARSVRGLCRQGDAAVDFLHDHPSAQPAGGIRRLIAELDDDDVRARAKAEKELRGAGDEAGTALRDALRSASDVELRGRLERLIQELQSFRLPRGDALRRCRELAVLERIGTARARALLEHLAAESPSDSQRAGARRSLQRLSSRP